MRKLIRGRQQGVLEVFHLHLSPGRAIPGIRRWLLLQPKCQGLKISAETRIREIPVSNEPSHGCDLLPFLIDTASYYQTGMNAPHIFLERENLNPRRNRPAGLSGPDQFDAVAGADPGVAGHAAHGIQTRWIDAKVLDQVLAHVKADHLAQYDDAAPRLVAGVDDRSEERRVG